METDNDGGIGPEQMADQDHAAAERMHGLEQADFNLEHGLEDMSVAMDRLGWVDAADNAALSAQDVHHAALNAKIGATEYDQAADAWTNVGHDLAEQARLTGAGYAASETASSAHAALAGAHDLTEGQKTELELMEARETSAVPVYEQRAADMGHEAAQEVAHAHALEASARLTDPESHLEPPE